MNNNTPVDGKNSNEAVKITVVRRKGGTVKNVTADTFAKTTEINEVPEPERRKESVDYTIYNDSFDDDYYEYEDIPSAEPVVAEPVCRQHNVTEPESSLTPGKMLKNIDVSLAVNGVGTAMVAAPNNIIFSAKTIFAGMLNYVKVLPNAIADYAEKIPSLVTAFFRRHDFVRWAKKSRTPMQWVRVGATALSAVLLVIVCVVLLAADSLLDKINYVASDHYGYISQSEADAMYWGMMGSDSDVSLSDISSNSDLDEEQIEAISLTLDKFTDDMFDVNEEDVVNILLLGTDTRSGKYVRDRSDTMILMSLDTKHNKIKLTSFMRDSYVTIPDYGKYRLNSAFAFGGADLLFKTLEKNFNVKVDKYIRVNFQAFKKVVDAVGGIEMYVTKAEAKYMCSHKDYGKFPRYSAGAGTYMMSGAEALNYARCRKVDSDFGRTDRQRKVLIAIANKLKTTNINTIYDLMNEILPLVETNLTKDEIYSLISPALGSISNEIETLNVPVAGSWKNYNANGAAVLSLDFGVNKKAIKAHIYSTTKLDLTEKVWQTTYFETGSGNKTTTTTTTATTSTESTAESTTETNTVQTTTTTNNGTPSSSTTTTSKTAESTTTTSSESNNTESTTTTTTTTTTTKATTTTTTTQAAGGSEDNGE